MGILNDISKKAQEYAGIAVDKAKDLAEVAADKAQALTDTAKVNMAIMSEQRELEKNYRAIGEWFVSEYQGEIPDAVKDVVAAVAASKERIAQLASPRRTSRWWTRRKCPSRSAPSAAPPATASSAPTAARPWANNSIKKESPCGLSFFMPPSSTPWGRRSAPAPAPSADR